MALGNRFDNSRAEELILRCVELPDYPLPRDEKITLCNELIGKIVSVYEETAASREELQSEYQEARYSMSRRRYL
jgi:hypothetical protein